jgi:hypothetical protein
MKRGILIKIIGVIVTLVILIKLLTIFFVEPGIRDKINAELSGENRSYLVETDKVHILIIRSGVELENIKIRSKEEQPGNLGFNGVIGSMKFKGIRLAKAIFKKDIHIREVIISNSSITGKFPFTREAILPVVTPFTIRISNILFDTIDIAVENSSDKQAFYVKEGVLKVYGLELKKQDTLSLSIINQFDFTAKKIVSVSPNSMHSYTAGGVIYSEASNSLAIDSFFVHPNYTDYDFTSRYQFQTSRVEAVFSNICLYDFYAADYISSGNLVSTWIEIGKMDMKVFRDKRKEFRHINRPVFQNLIYNYPDNIQIDSIGLLDGNVTYTEHAEEANKSGGISFNEINAKIYKISNDTIYKTNSAFLEFKGDALLMGKGRMTILLKGRIFDSHNRFSLDGTLSELDANELNPILEKSAFVYATSGKIDAMNFSFMADNTKATGEMTMLYHDLHLTVKNKRTDDTTAFKERFISFVANRRVLDSNPVPGGEVRVGIIDSERDPERFLIHYCFRALLSGMKSSLLRYPKK